MSDRVARMVAEAESRIFDAELLGSALQAQSDAPIQLRIIALEILLKALQLQTLGRVSRTHNYVELWSALPLATRGAVLTLARARYPGHTDFSAVERLLAIYEFLFTKARYGYELYDDLSLAESHALGEEWAARGAPTHEADIQYFPMELSALLEALCKVARSAA